MFLIAAQYSVSEITNNVKRNNDHDQRTSIATLKFNERGISQRSGNIAQRTLGIDCLSTC